MKGGNYDDKNHASRNGDVVGTNLRSVRRCLLSCFGCDDTELVREVGSINNRCNVGSCSVVKDMQSYQKGGTLLQELKSPGGGDAGGDRFLLRYFENDGSSQQQEQRQQQRYTLNSASGMSGRDDYSSPLYNDNRHGLGDGNPEHELWESNHSNMHRVNNQGQRRGIPSPRNPPSPSFNNASPNSGVDGANFDSTCRIGGNTGPQVKVSSGSSSQKTLHHPPPSSADASGSPPLSPTFATPPQHRYSSNDCISIQSDLAESNRRVTFRELTEDPEIMSAGQADNASWILSAHTYPPP